MTTENRNTVFDKSTNKFLRAIHERPRSDIEDTHEAKENLYEATFEAWLSGASYTDPYSFTKISRPETKSRNDNGREQSK